VPDPRVQPPCHAIVAVLTPLSHILQYHPPYPPHLPIALHQHWKCLSFLSVPILLHIHHTAGSTVSSWQLYTNYMMRIFSWKVLVRNCQLSASQRFIPMFTTAHYWPKPNTTPKRTQPEKSQVAIMNGNCNIHSHQWNMRVMALGSLLENLPLCTCPGIHSLCLWTAHRLTLGTWKHETLLTRSPHQQC